MGRDAKAANRAQMNRQAKARNGHASRESAGRTPPLGAAAKPGSMVCMTCGLPEQGAVHHADIRALEARVKELEGLVLGTPCPRCDCPDCVQKVAGYRALEARAKELGRGAKSGLGGVSPGDHGRATGDNAESASGSRTPVPPAAKPGPPSETTEEYWHRIAVAGEAEARALEARVKELEAALREAKRAMDSYAPKGEPSLRGRYDTRAQAMVDAALRGKP